MYGTLVGAGTYHTARGNSAWTGSDADKTAALVRATDYIDGRYRVMLRTGKWVSMFRGSRTEGRSQDHEWPRLGATDAEGNAIDDDVVPIEVEYATYEAALRELVTPGSLSPDFVPNTQVTKEKVGPIELSYADGSGTGSTPNRPIVPVIDEIIAPLIYEPSDYRGAVVV